MRAADTATGDVPALPIGVVFLSPPRATAGTATAGEPVNHYEAEVCTSSLSNYGEWARHRNGWGD